MSFRWTMAGSARTRLPLQYTCDMPGSFTASKVLTPQGQVPPFALLVILASPSRLNRATRLKGYRGSDTPGLKDTPYLPGATKEYSLEHVQG